MVGGDARNELDSIGIPLLYVRDSLAEFGPHGFFIDAKQARIIGEMPFGEIRAFLFCRRLWTSRASGRSA